MSSQPRDFLTRYLSTTVPLRSWAPPICSSHRRVRRAPSRTRGSIRRASNRQTIWWPARRRRARVRWLLTDRRRGVAAVVPLTTLGWLHQRLPCQHVVEHIERTAIRPALDQSVSWNDQRRCPLSPSEAIATESFDADEIQRTRS